MLLPVLHQIVSRNEYDSLGEDFERIEHKQLGVQGFERAVDYVAEIEKKLGIYELSPIHPGNVRSKKFVDAAYRRLGSHTRATAALSGDGRPRRHYGST